MRGHEDMFFRSRLCKCRQSDIIKNKNKQITPQKTKTKTQTKNKIKSNKNENFFETALSITGSMLYNNDHQKQYL